MELKSVLRLHHYKKSMNPKRAMNLIPDPNNAEPKAHGTRRIPAWIGAVFLLAIAYVSALAKMRTYGRMGSEMTYDDVVYALKGLDFAEAIIASGFVRAFAFSITNVHAPMSEMIASISAVLFGASTTGVYFLNSLWVTSLSVALCLVVFWNRRVPALLAAALFLLSPLGFFLLDQFRPDPSYALLASILAAYSGALISTSGVITNRQGLILVTIVALLFYSKPSMFVMSGVIAILTCLTICIYRRWILRKALFERKTALLSLGAFAGLMTPFGLLLLPRQIRYVYENMLGASSDVWTTYGPVEAVVVSVRQAVAALFSSLSLFGLILGIIVLLIGAAFLRTPPGRAVPAVVAGVAACGPVAMTRSPSVFFGLIPVMLLLTGVSVLTVDTWRQFEGSYLLRGNTVFPRIWLVLSTSVAAAFLVTTAVPPKYPVPEGLRAPYLVNQRLLESAILQCSQKSACEQSSTSRGETPAILVTTAAEVSPDSFKWVAGLNGWKPNVLALPFLVREEQIDTYLEEVDFVVVLGDEAQYVNPNLPVHQVQTELRRYLVGPNWEPIPVPVVGKSYNLYSRVASITQ